MAVSGHCVPVPKIDSGRRPAAARGMGAGRRPDGTPDDDDRVEIGPTALAFREWEAAEVRAPDLEALRAYRLERLRGELRRNDCVGLLLFDPLNIRYATDTTNMQVRITHNPSRTWICGAGRATNEQRELNEVAREHIAANLDLLRPGLGFAELTEKSQRLPERYRSGRYSVIAHGTGLCDEYPSIKYPEDYAGSGSDGVFEPGMMVSVEAYVGAEGGSCGVKLEEQALVIETGHDLISSYPLEDW